MLENGSSRRRPMWARAASAINDPCIKVWNGGLEGPSTAAEAPHGAVMLDTPDRGMWICESIEACRKSCAPPDVCFTPELAKKLGSPYAYAERRSLDSISWGALGTGIASPFGYAKTLRLLITARRCRVRCVPGSSEPDCACDCEQRHRQAKTTFSSLESQVIATPRPERLPRRKGRRRKLPERTIPPRRAGAIDLTGTLHATGRRKRVLPRVPTAGPSTGCSTQPGRGLRR